MLFFILQCLGVLTLISIIRTFSPFLLSKVMGPKNLKKAGTWAIVTGCTDGIGKAYCEKLAKKGLNLLLISRTKSKLDDQAKELESTYKIATKVVPADCSKSFDTHAAAIAAAVKECESKGGVSVLINNVGVSYEYPCYFAEEDTTDELISNLVNVNATTAMAMTKLVLPGMTAQKGGTIINISSAAGVMPCGSPMLAGYSATKCFLAAFSKSIQYETSSKGITCQVHAPYFVSTKMSKIRKASFMVPSPETWVTGSLSMVGYGGTVLVPYFAHFLQDFVCNIVPEELIGWYTLRLHKDIRKRALKKKARLEAEAASTKKD